LFFFRQNQLVSFCKKRTHTKFLAIALPGAG
jgi:hypothetical protein